MRANFRPLFTLHPVLHWFYDIITWFVTMIFFAPYSFGPFLCNNIEEGIMVCSSVLLLLLVVVVVVVVGVVVITLLALCLRGTIRINANI